MTARTFQAAPPNPSLLPPTLVSQTSMTLNWKSSGGNVNNTLVSILSNGTYPAAQCSGGTKVEAGTSLNISALTANTVYRYRVCAVNGQGVASSGSTSYKRTLP